MLDWFGANGRDLPWRHSRDPWVILVSELMLQQTQASRVVQRLPGFLKLFPTPSACAGASAADVITAWSGLGYNRRAINLHRAASSIAQNGGAVPRTRSALLALPGVGPYTARAVRVFAFEEADAVVDTNIGRILARVSGRNLKAKEAQSLADSWIRSDLAWIWNQSLMEVGALLCRPVPDCSNCPLKPACSWAQAGHPSPDPSRNSAQVSKGQSTFEGSDRQGRGRLLVALQAGAMPIDAVPAAMGWPEDPSRAKQVLETLLKDGLVRLGPNGYRLP